MINYLKYDKLFEYANGECTKLHAWLKQISQHESKHRVS